MEETNILICLKKRNRKSKKYQQNYCEAKRSQFSGQ